MDRAVEVVAAVIRRGGQALIASRKQEGWEFPGGKIEPGETPAEALRRELEEELSIRDALVLDEICRIRHAYPDKTVHLHFLRTLQRLPRQDRDPRGLRRLEYLLRKEGRSRIQGSLQ